MIDMLYSMHLIALQIHMSLFSPFLLSQKKKKKSNGSYEIKVFLHHDTWLVDVIVTLGLGVGLGKGDHLDCMIQKHPAVSKHPHGDFVKLIS